METTRCSWTKNNSWNNAYHDTEWGVPLHNDKKLFEFLVLDAFQAGLSWLTILKKRENFREAFDDFDVQKIVGYDEEKISQLLADKSIIRNKLKIKATITNARAFIKICEQYESFDTYIWQFVNYKPIINHWKKFADIPATSKESDAMSKDLKKRGFTFTGSTICYAFMQAAGMVNDHEINCFRYEPICRLMQE